MRLIILRKEMMNEMVVILNYYKANKVDLKEYYRKYDNPRAQYKLLQGAPLLVNVQGSYVEAYNIPDLIVNKSQRVFSEVNKWLSELRNPSNVDGGVILEFRWRK